MKAPGKSHSYSNLLATMACSYVDRTPCLSYALSCLKKEDLTLKKEQVEAITLLCSGNNAFLWLLMGLGKSICYQSLSIIFDYKLGKISAPTNQ